MLTATTLLLGIMMDQLFGEPKRFHPLVGFGFLAHKVELHLNRSKGFLGQLAGFIALLLMVAPLGLAGALIWWWLLDNYPIAAIVFAATVLYWSIGWYSLSEHVNAVYTALKEQDLSVARIAIQQIVSRDCKNLNTEDIARASLETLLENTSDAVVGPLFWFAVLGPAGAIVYRLSNTLDAMWGYRNERFLDFGRASARWDDFLNLIPARLTALCFVIASNRRESFSCWKKYARNWESPNAGPVICAGSGALNVSLGGGGTYNGQWCNKPATPGRVAAPEDINLGKTLVCRAILIALTALCVVTTLAGTEW